MFAVLDGVCERGEGRHEAEAAVDGGVDGAVGGGWGRAGEVRGRVGARGIRRNTPCLHSSARDISQTKAAAATQAGRRTFCRSPITPTPHTPLPFLFLLLLPFLFLLLLLLPLLPHSNSSISDPSRREEDQPPKQRYEGAPAKLYYGIVSRRLRSVGQAETAATRRGYMR